MDGALLVSGRAAYLLSRARSGRPLSPAEKVEATQTWVSINEVARLYLRRAEISFTGRDFAAGSAADIERRNGEAAASASEGSSGEDELTTEEVALMLNKGVRRVQQLAPGLGAVRRGRRWVFSRDAVVSHWARQS